MSLPKFTPQEWLAAALSQPGPANAFKLLQVDGPTFDGQPIVVMRVLHKDSGAVWRFACSIERDGVV